MVDSANLGVQDVAGDIRAELARYSRQWGWVIAMGIVSMILGVIALYQPYVSTLGLTLTLGVLLGIGGIAELVQAVRLRRARGSVARFIYAAVALVAGFLMLRNPGAGMLSVAIVLSFYFLVSAAAKGALAIAMRGMRGSWLMMLSALASFFIGVVMIWTFPISALWVPGMLLGIDLIFGGSMAFGYGLTLRRAYKELTARGAAPEARRAA
jgi:uncharacterized membrane protein HdeD (DUF308 family)